MARRFRGAGALFACAVVSCAEPPREAQVPASAVSSLRQADCFTPPQDIRAEYDARDLGVQECRGHAGWRVFVVSSDANAWLELRSGAQHSTLEDAIVYESPIGLFPGVHAASGIEWRLDPQGRAAAMIFTVSGQNPADASSRVSKVFVARLADGRACVAGRVETIEQARALAAGPLSCAGG